jgi:hypothetical protein
MMNDLEEYRVDLEVADQEAEVPDVQFLDMISGGLSIVNTAYSLAKALFSTE